MACFFFLLKKPLLYLYYLCNLIKFIRAQRMIPQFNYIYIRSIFTPRIMVYFLRMKIQNSKITLYVELLYTSGTNRISGEKGPTPVRRWQAYSD